MFIFQRTNYTVIDESFFFAYYVCMHIFPTGYSSKGTGILLDSPYLILSYTQRSANTLVLTKKEFQVPGLSLTHLLSLFLGEEYSLIPVPRRNQIVA